MEPPVIAIGKRKSKFFILKVVLSNVHIITITGNVMHWFAGQFNFFLRMFSADIAALHQFLFDLSKIRFVQSNVKCVADRFQILDIIGSFLDQLRQCFKCTLLFVVFCKITLRILARSLCRIKRDSNLFVGIIIQAVSSFDPGSRL